MSHKIVTPSVASASPSQFDADTGTGAVCDTARIIPLNAHRSQLTVGTYAVCRGVGFCKIVGQVADITQRKVQWAEHVPDAVPDTSDLPIGEDPDSVISSEQIYLHELVVDVVDLQPADEWSAFRAIEARNYLTIEAGWVK